MELELHDRIRILRTQAKMSQEAVAFEIGVDYTTYGRYERGENELKFKQASKLADLYGISMEELLSGNKPAYDSETVKSIVQETQEVYAAKEKQSIVVSIKLDGLQKTVDYWIDRIQKINEMVKT